MILDNEKSFEGIPEVYGGFPANLQETLEGLWEEEMVDIYGEDNW